MRRTKGWTEPARFWFQETVRLLYLLKHVSSFHVVVHNQDLSKVLGWGKHAWWQVESPEAATSSICILHHSYNHLSSITNKAASPDFPNNPNCHCMSPHFPINRPPPPVPAPRLSQSANQRQMQPLVTLTDISPTVSRPLRELRRMMLQRCSKVPKFLMFYINISPSKAFRSWRRYQLCSFLTVSVTLGPHSVSRPAALNKLPVARSAREREWILLYFWDAWPLIKPTQFYLYISKSEKPGRLQNLCQMILIYQKLMKKKHQLTIRRLADKTLLQIPQWSIYMLHGLDSICQTKLQSAC